MKITDILFAIPDIIAIQHIGTALSGANRPLFIEGIDKQQGIRGDYLTLFLKTAKHSNKRYGKN